MRIVLAQINPTIGDLSGNTEKILANISRAKKQGATVVLFPELALTGYPPEDFLLLPHFINALEHFLIKIKEASEGITVILGTPRKSDNDSEKPVFNSAVIFKNGTLLGYQDKSLLPTYDVFDERRYFEPSISTKLWDIDGKKVAITICEDIWKHSGLLKNDNYRRDPILDLKALKPDLLLNLSASPFSISKFGMRQMACSKAAMTLNCPVLLCNQIGGNDSLIFDGYSLFVNSDGKLLKCAKGFKEDFLFIDLSEKISENIDAPEDVNQTIFNALVIGVRDYFHKLGFFRACLGLSGGIDSALVACIATEALGRENVLGILMPSRYSSESSLTDSLQLVKNLGIQHREISIEPVFEKYIETLSHHFNGKDPDITEENLQARIRGMILMALSNKLGYIVLSTGNKSELAMGYSTLYGDMCGGLGVINDITKRQVYALSNWINRNGEIIPSNTIQKPPSAELAYNQKDSDTLPEYDVIDNVLQAYVEEHHSPEEIAKIYHYSLDLVNDLVKRIHCNEYKRRQNPPGLRISEKAFSVGRHFPIVQRWI